MTSRIAEVVRNLDPENDAHWTQSGLPAMAAVEAVLGKAVSRADVEHAVPNWTRDLARQAPRHGVKDNRAVVREVVERYREKIAWGDRRGDLRWIDAMVAEIAEAVR